MLKTKTYTTYIRVVTPIDGGGYRVTYYLRRNNEIFCDLFINEENKLRRSREGERFFNMKPILNEEP